MKIFNQDTRTKNVIKTSLVSFICSIFNLSMSFIYRTLFLNILSTAYLGISGLFSNILLIFSLAELGITSAIIYRFYEPISLNNVQKVGEIMNFLKNIYRVVIGVILFLGFSLYPFLGYFISDVSEIPKDVNIQVVYVLYLAQTIASYIFAYKQAILSADQREYVLALWRTLTNFVIYSIQIVILIFLRNFALSIAAGVVISVLMNCLIGIWITGKYKPIFKVDSNLSKKEKKRIFIDTKATMCHKIGGTIAGGTDNIVLSTFVGLTITGIYSNYSLILTGVRTISSRLLGGFTSSFGSAHVEQGEEAKYLSYKRMVFADFWISGMVIVCLYNLIDDFISIWIGESYRLNHITVVVLCINFYAELCRAVSTSYIDGCGLFVKDKVRPLIEAVLNLSISVFLVKRIGITGVFLGTLVSQIFTVLWREPYILYKFEFKKNVLEYWKTYAKFALSTLLITCITNLLLSYLCIFNFTLTSWIMEGVVCAFIYNICAYIILNKSDDFLFFKNMFCKKIERKCRWKNEKSK